MTPAEVWVPMRRVYRAVVCDFCWCRIPPGKPGTSTGTRGTKAWYSPRRDVWECLACHTELMRAIEARWEARAARQVVLSPAAGGVLPAPAPLPINAPGLEPLAGRGILDLMLEEVA